MIDYPREDAEKARELEALRLDRLQRALWPQCLREDKNQHWAIDRVLKISDQRARLLGLNRPVRQEITVISEDAVDNAIRALEAEIELTTAQAGITLDDDPAEIVPE
jgi:hypothetical protein